MPLQTKSAIAARLRASRYYHQRFGANACRGCGASPQAGLKFCVACAAQNRAVHRRSALKLRAEFMGAYGGVCACCSEANPYFLTCDHVNSDGRWHQQRKQQGWVDTNTALRDARRRGWPADYQILCYNCNLARAKYQGICPHRFVQAVVSA